MTDAVAKIVKDVVKSKTPGAAVASLTYGVAQFLAENADAPSETILKFAEALHDKGAELGEAVDKMGPREGEGAAADNFPDRAAFDAWLTGFNAGNTVSLDGSQVKEGHGNTIVFYTRADGTIDTKAPALT
jgi:hypothetical protein